MITEQELDKALQMPIQLYFSDGPLLITENIRNEIIENFKRAGLVDDK